MRNYEKPEMIVTSYEGENVMTISAVSSTQTTVTDVDYGDLGF